MSDTVTTYRADRLVAAKEKSGKNNSEIARETGYSRPTVISVFKGDSDSVDAIQAVANSVGVPMSELFSEAA